MKDNQHEQLFTELTPEEGSAISGGVEYTFKNRLNEPMTFTILNPQQGQQTLQPFGKDGDTLTLDLPELKILVGFDQKRGEGFTPITKFAEPGVSSFDVIDKDVITLGTGGEIIPQIKV